MDPETINQLQQGPLSNDQLLAYYNQVRDPLRAQVDNYINGLMDIAQGDLDRVSKIIEENFQTALGTDDTARKDFFKQVANELENKVGRIVFDYRTGKNRIEEDVQRETQRTQESTQMALQRLLEDEQIAREGLTRDTLEARRQQGTSLNERGILAGPRDEAVGLAGQEVGNLEGEINRKFQSLERTLGRTREDINTGQERTLADIGRTGARSIEDLTTQSRRAGMDAETTQERGLNAARTEFERRQQELEALKREQQQRADLQARQIFTNQYLG